MTHSPKFAYHPEANAVYVYFSDNDIAETPALSRSVYVDVDVDGVPVGLQVLNATAAVIAGVPTSPDSAALKDLMQTLRSMASASRT